MARAADTFVETGGDVDITAHTPTGTNAGTGWALAITGNGDVDVISATDLAENVSQSSGNRLRETTDLGSDQMDVQMDLTFTAAATGKFAGPCGRYQNASGTGIEFTYDEALGGWNIDDNSGNTDFLSEAAPTWPRTLLLQIRTSDMRGFDNGTEKVALAVNTFSGRQYAGMMLGQFGITGRAQGDNYDAQSAGGTNYTQPVSGSITAAGSIAKQLIRILAGTTTPAGALSRLTSRLLAGSTTLSGLSLKTMFVATSGSITAAGALVRSTLRTLAGAITPTGVVSRALSRALTGSVTLAGALQRTTSRVLTGSLTAAGALSRETARLLTGSITPSGTVALATVFTVALAGSITLAGSLATVAILAMLLTGAITVTGSLSRMTSKLLSGSLTLAGALNRGTLRLLAGAISVAGALATAYTGFKTLAGSITLSGILSSLLNPDPGGGGVVQWFNKLVLNTRKRRRR